MAHMSNYLVTDAQIAIGGTFTSAPINIEKATAACIHLQSLVGTLPDVGFSYTVSSSRNGTYLAGLATTSASESAAVIIPFTPEPASWLKMTVTNNSGANVVTPTVVLALADAD